MQARCIQIWEAVYETLAFFARFLAFRFLRHLPHVSIRVLSSPFFSVLTFDFTRVQPFSHYFFSRFLSSVPLPILCLAASPIPDRGRRLVTADDRKETGKGPGNLEQCVSWDPAQMARQSGHFVTLWPLELG